jgi:hypothetical protein
MAFIIYAARGRGYVDSCVMLHGILKVCGFVAKCGVRLIA